MNENRYATKQETDDDKLKYYFKSRGNTIVIKAIEYSPIHAWGERVLYNLGFGDYNAITGEILDDSSSNNGDAYKVFNTVLSTISKFFDIRPAGIIFVQGSDSSNDYYNKCKPTCKKRCTDICKNAGRRIVAYRGYVNKHYEELIKAYSFLGGFNDEKTEKTSIEVYKKGVEYDVILVIRKM